MAEKLIADSSPLIVLLKSDLEIILPELFDEIIVPEEVWEEILAGKINDIAKEKLPSLSWLKRTSTKVSEKILETQNLGKGEAAVLNLALTISKSRVLVDDFAARKSAKELKIPFLGTGGLLVLAKRNGLILKVTESLVKVRHAGLWLSDEVVQMIIEKAGE